MDLFICCLCVGEQKQACELAGLEQQKASLQMELEQWRRIRQQIPVNPPAIDPERLQAQVKQLTQRLKVSYNYFQFNRYSLYI